MPLMAIKKTELYSSLWRHEIKLEKDKLSLYVHPNTSLSNRNLVLSQFYRIQLKNRIEKRDGYGLLLTILQWSCTPPRQSIQSLIFRNLLNLLAPRDGFEPPTK